MIFHFPVSNITGGLLCDSGNEANSKIGILSMTTFIEYLWHVREYTEHTI